MGSNKFLCERAHGASRICFSKISRIYFSSFSFSLSFFFVLGFFQEGTFDSTREDFLEEGAFRLGFGESSSNA